MEPEFNCKVTKKGALEDLVKVVLKTGVPSGSAWVGVHRRTLGVPTELHSERKVFTPLGAPFAFPCTGTMVLLGSTRYDERHIYHEYCELSVINSIAKVSRIQCMVYAPWVGPCERFIDSTQ